MEYKGYSFSLCHSKGKAYVMIREGNKFFRATKHHPTDIQALADAKSIVDIRIESGESKVYDRFKGLRDWLSV